MDVEPLAIPDVCLVRPPRFDDERGYFSELFVDKQFRAEVADVTFVQDNQSVSRKAGVLRGLHFQAPPHAQGKLVRCARGSIVDVAVDIRTGSPTFGRHVAVELSAMNGFQLWIPIGFAHGFCALEPDTAVAYRVTDYYAPECERGIAYDDPALGIGWPLAAGTLMLSPKDRTHPPLAAIGEVFRYAPSPARR
jgi:dTDP-4-dehydrorhamnose 3,5-epimerase